MQALTPIWLLSLILLTVTACTTQVPEPYQDDPRVADRPPAYVDGFYDGVRTGYHLTGNYWTAHILDVERYRANEQYRSGWDSGLRAVLETPPQ